MSVAKEHIDDILLLNLIKEGNERAFKHLFDTYFESLCRFVYVYIPETAVVEELVSDIFLHVWENRETLQLKISFKAYLFQAARNRSLNYWRDKKESVIFDDLCDGVVEMQDLESAELSKLIQEAILALPDKCREIFIVSRRDGLTNREIAGKMNVTVKTVETHITKALKRIKAFLGENYYYLF